MQQGTKQPLKERDIEPAINQRREPVVIPAGAPPTGPTPPVIGGAPAPARPLPMSGKNPYDP
jgi:hypothetical protein